MGIRERVAALLGVTAYQPRKGYGPELDASTVERIRSMLGGNLAPMPTTQIRWYLSDLETAAHNADQGDMTMVCRLWRAMRRDGNIQGLYSTLTGGIVGLPKKFYGRYGVEELRARNGTRSTFDDLVPPAEGVLMADEVDALGFAIGELVPLPGRSFPRLVRLEPEFLRYRWIENRWYYSSVAGALPITPGDGRWVLHLPGGTIAPWLNAKLPALGRSFINKEHAMLHRSNYGAKLANPARVAEAPAGSTEVARDGFLSALMAWGINTVFELPPGWEASLLESKGTGFEVFQAEIDTSDKEIAITIIGQIVTVEGGVGFQNSDVFRAIHDNRKKEVGGALSYTLNTQVLPYYVAGIYGEDVIDEGACIEYDITPARDAQAEGQAMNTVAQAMKLLREELKETGRELDVAELTTRYGIPIKGDVDGDGVPDTKTDVPKAEPSEADIIDDDDDDAEAEGAVPR